jgi:hypothetical protein
MTYRLQIGVRDEEDNAVFAENAFGEIDYGPTFADALYSLNDHICRSGNTLQQIDGGLFKHLPGVEGIFAENWLDEAKQEKERIWLIRRLTTF